MQTRNLRGLFRNFSLLKFGGMTTLVAALLVGSISPVFADYTGTPSITPISVASGAYVYVKVDNLPVNTDFTVTEGAAGTQGINGGLISHFNSGEGGSQTLLFETYAPLRSADRIDLRIAAVDGPAAYVTFANSPKLAQKEQTTAAEVSKSANISVVSVTQNGAVQVEIYNLPKDVDFTVSMSEVGATKSATLVGGVTRTSDLNAVIATFEIPTTLANSSWITLNLTAEGYHFTQNFANVTTD